MSFEVTPLEFRSDASGQPLFYSTSAMTQLQKISTLQESDEFGAILTLQTTAAVNFTVPELLDAQPASLNFLNQFNQALTKCTDEAEVSAELIRFFKSMNVTAQCEVQLYDLKLKKLAAASVSLTLKTIIETVFATGEVRRGVLPNQLPELSYLAVPLVSGRNIYGVVYATSMRRFSRNELDVLVALGQQAGGSLESLHLYAEQERTCENMIQALALTIDARDEITAGHSGRVANYSAAIARYMGLSAKEQRLIYYAGLLHDYGKIGVRDDVLCKPSQLTSEEYEEIKKHPAFTLSILSKIKFSDALTDVPYVASCHHERPDGKGYPNGLKGEEIPLGSSIISVADVFDALTVKRHYRDPMPNDEVIAVLEGGRGTQFDGAVIDAFKRFYSEEYLVRYLRHRK